MGDRLTASSFDRDHDLPDWRILLHGVEAWFAAPSFSEGAEFVQAVARAADDADHHPDVELRYPGKVHVRLTSHDVDGLSTRDADLARRISDLATERGITAEPRASTRLEVAIDAIDSEAVRPFWAAALGYVDDSPDADGVVRALRDPAGIGPAFWFQQMDAPRPQRNRIHIDVTVPEDEVQARIDATLAAGGTLVSDAEAPSFWILADAEGNEACLCTWQDRD